MGHVLCYEKFLKSCEERLRDEGCETVTLKSYSGDPYYEFMVNKNATENSVKSGHGTAKFPLPNKYCFYCGAENESSPNETELNITLKEYFKI